MTTVVAISLVLTSSKRVTVSVSAGPTETVLTPTSENPVLNASTSHSAVASTGLLTWKCTVVVPASTTLKLMTLLVAWGLANPQPSQTINPKPTTATTSAIMSSVRGLARFTLP